MHNEHLLYNRYKVGHLYKAVFDNGCRDDVSVDAAVIKLQNRIPNTAEFTDAERTRLKSAGTTRAIRLHESFL